MKPRVQNLVTILFEFIVHVVPLLKKKLIDMGHCLKKRIDKITDTRPGLVLLKTLFGTKLLFNKNGS